MRLRFWQDDLSKPASPETLERFNLITRHLALGEPLPVPPTRTQRALRFGRQHWLALVATGFVGGLGLWFGIRENFVSDSTPAAASVHASSTLGPGIDMVVGWEIHCTANLALHPTGGYTMPELTANSESDCTDLQRYTQQDKNSQIMTYVESLTYIIQTPQGTVFRVTEDSSSYHTGNFLQVGSPWPPAH